MGTLTEVMQKSTMVHTTEYLGYIVGTSYTHRSFFRYYGLGIDVCARLTHPVRAGFLSFNSFYDKGGIP